MTDKICGFCGEPIAGGLQEHDFATCAHNLRDRVIQLEAALELIGGIAFDRDGYKSAESLGELVDELYRYARNPADAAKRLRGES